MSLDTRERSRASGRPVNLYNIRYGTQPASYVGYTDAEVEIVHGGATYVPIAIDRDTIKASGTLDKSSLTVTVPHNTTIPELFRVFPPSEVISMIIYQGHSNDPDMQYVACWAGKVLSCGHRPGNIAELTCEPIAAALRRTGLRRNYMYACPHALYGPDCRAIKADAKTEAEVFAIDGTYVYLPDGWTGSPPLKYVTGLVEWTTATNERERRSILRVISGKVLMLDGPPRGLEEGMTVDVFLGCDHNWNVNPLLTDCEALHNNINNFGGQPFIPSRNPLGLVNQFY